MEASRNMRVVAMAMMVMLVLAGQASAGLRCFSICLTKCSVETGLFCVFKCLRQCLLPVDSTPNPLYYCQLGCSMDECATKLSHDSEEMESCVDNCRSNVCMHA